jgi:hypothetical protein
MERFLWGKDGLTFGSLLRSLNPLQHIPVISTIYQSVTGDSIGAVARVIGATLIGGPIGAVTSLANALFEAGTGKDVGGHVMATLFGDDKAPAAAPLNGPAIAAATSSPLPSGAAPVNGLPWLAVAPSSPASAPTPNASLVARSAGSSSSTPSTLVGGESDVGPAQIAASSRRGIISPPLNPVGDAQAPGVASHSMTAGTTSPVAVPADFTQRMLQALDKYQAAARLRTGTAAAVDIGS